MLRSGSTGYGACPFSDYIHVRGLGHLLVMKLGCVIVNRISGGFDLRIRVDAQEQDPRQVGQYLLPEKQNSVSADPWIWTRADEVDELIVNDLVSYPLGLPMKLDDLFTALRERGIATADFSPVCLTVSEATAQTLCEIFGSSYFDNAPDDEHLMSCGWRFLGFDPVELNGLTSALKGIGYKEPLWSQLRARFGGALNEVGLFRDEPTASQFAEMRAVEIPSHAPFDVVGILVHDPII